MRFGKDVLILDISWEFDQIQADHKHVRPGSTVRIRSPIPPTRGSVVTVVVGTR